MTNAVNLFFHITCKLKSIPSGKSFAKGDEMLPLKWLCPCYAKDMPDCWNKVLRLESMGKMDAKEEFYSA
jgi:hypothetical protein